MAIRWPITSTASMALLVGIRPASDLVEVAADAGHLLGALALDLGVRRGPSVRPTDRPAHQIRQRQPAERALACHSARSASLARTFTQTARPRLHGAPFPVRGSEGAQPPASSAGDSRSVAPRSKLAEPRNGRQRSPWSRVRDPAAIVADAVAEHLRERSAEPVQTDLAKRGWRWTEAGGAEPPTYSGDRSGDCSADAAVDGHGHRFDRGMDQP